MSKKLINKAKKTNAHKGICFNSINSILNKRQVISLLFIIALITSLPLFTSGIYYGDDLAFHLARIQGLETELKNFVFPVRISSYWLGGYGYPVSIYYPDLFLYIPALLLLLGVPIVTAYKFFVLLVNIATVFLGYYCFYNIVNYIEKFLFASGKNSNTNLRTYSKPNSGNQKVQSNFSFQCQIVALVLTFVYSCTNYRLTAIYARSAVGEFCAITFLPLVALALVEIYFEPTKDFKKQVQDNLSCKTSGYHKFSPSNPILKYSTHLALGMTGLLTTHILSTLMTVCVVFITCLILIKKTLRKHTLLTFLLAILKTVILNLYFLVPFIDYYFSVDVKITNPDLISTNIQYTGAKISDLFNYFSNPLTGTGVISNLQLNSGAVLTLVLVCGVTFCLINIFKYIKQLLKKSSFNLTGRTSFNFSFGFVGLVSALSLVTLWISTMYFPWNFLSDKIALIRMICQIQFPWRFLEILCVLLTVLLGYFLISVFQIPGGNWVGKSVVYITCAICLLTVLAFSGSYFSRYSISMLTADGTLQDTLTQTGVTESVAGYDSFSISGGEYILKGTDLTLVDETSNDKTFSQSDTNGNLLISFPVFNYKGYVATDSEGNQLKILNGDNNTIALEIPENSKGNYDINIKFTSPLAWRLSEVLSLLMMIVLLSKSYNLWLCSRKRDVE